MLVAAGGWDDELEAFPGTISRTAAVVAPGLMAWPEPSRARHHPRAATVGQREAQLVNEQLTNALTSRIVIEQAKGVVFERARIDMAGGVSRLRNYARDNNLLLTDVAHATIDGTLDPEVWAPPSPSTRS